MIWFFSWFPPVPEGALEEFPLQPGADRDDVCCCCVSQISRAPAQLPGSESAGTRGVPWRPPGVRQCHGLPALLILPAQCRSETGWGLLLWAQRSPDWNMGACGMGGKMQAMRMWGSAASAGDPVTPHQSDRIANFKIPFFLLFFFSLHFTAECKMQVDEMVGHRSHCSSTG